MKRFSSRQNLYQKIIRKVGLQIPLNANERQFLFNETDKNIHPEFFNFSHLSHDEWNITQRQSKQIVNSSKVWNFFGYTYLLPLWDNDLYDFFMSMPFEYRVSKKLFEEVLREFFSQYQLFFEEDHGVAGLKKHWSIWKLKIKGKFPFMANLRTYKPPPRTARFFLF